MTDLKIGDKVVTTWSLQHGIRGTIVGYGDIVDVDQRSYPVYIVLLPNPIETTEEVREYRAVRVAVMRRDRVVINGR